MFISISYQAIGRNIRTARCKNKLSQTETAERLDMSLVHYGRMERGERRISLEEIHDAAQILNTSIYDILNGMTTETVFAPATAKKSRTGMIIDFLCAGCSDKARTLMIDICALIAKHDKYEKS